MLSELLVFRSDHQHSIDERAVNELTILNCDPSTYFATAIVRSSFGYSLGKGDVIIILNMNQRLVVVQKVSTFDIVQR
jgi:hypothetical protein